MKLTKPQPALLPCPFCGSDAACYSWQDEDLWSHNIVEWQKVRCTGCELEGQSSCVGYEESEAAVAVWNTRAPQWQPIETVPHGKWVYVASVGASCGGVAMLADYWINPDMRPDQYAERATHWQPLPAPLEVEG